jgi:hypothetical protein
MKNELDHNSRLSPILLCLVLSLWLFFTFGCASPEVITFGEAKRASPLVITFGEAKRAKREANHQKSLALAEREARFASPKVMTSGDSLRERRGLAPRARAIHLW